MTLTIRPGVTLKPGITVAKPLPPESYSLSSDGNGVNEGSSKTIDVTTTAVPDGTILYWATSIQGTNMSFGRLSPGSGSVTVTGGAASFSITVSADNLTSTDQQAFFVHLFKGAPNGQPGCVGVGDLTIYVNDTSQSPHVYNTAHTVNSGWTNDMFGADTVFIQDSAPDTPTPQVGWTVTDGVNTRTIVSSGFGVNHQNTGFGFFWLLQLNSAVNFNDALTLTLSN
jgi:hypothetical protein